MSENSGLREFIYLDWPRVRSLAGQLKVEAGEDRERAAAEVEERVAALVIDSGFDFAQWTPEKFRDGQFVLARGAVRLLDYTWLATALGGLPAVLKKMSKLEMDALRNSDEGRRMSKSQLQQRSQENQLAISRVEEFKIDELGDVVRGLYGNLVRVKIRPSAQQSQAILVGAAYVEHFADAPAVLSQKYGVEVDANWSVLGQLNMNQTPTVQPMPIGNRMEDSFEQIALLMNNAFRVANAPAWPAVSITPIAIYRSIA